MTTKIEGSPTGPLDTKRCYLRGVTVTAECPSCGHIEETDFGKEKYLAYPRVNETFDLGLYCYSCGHEWSVQAELRISLVLAGQPEPKALYDGPLAYFKSYFADSDSWYVAITPEEYERLAEYKYDLQQGNWPAGSPVDLDLMDREHCTNPDLSRDDIIEIALC